MLILKLFGKIWNDGEGVGNLWEIYFVAIDLM